MARSPRQTAQSGIYHIVLRPNGIRALFPVDADAEKVIELLAAEQERDAAEIFAYCLLDTAAHLVYKEGISGITANMMRLARNYANYCNQKYNQTGKLFYGRFGSEPLETPAMILDATRFVHRLPLKYGLPILSERSSYRRYFQKSGLLSNEAVISLLGSAADYRLYCDAEPEHRFLGGK